MVFQDGLMKCTKKGVRNNTLEYITKSFLLRSANGTAVGAVGAHWKLMNPNMFHYSRESFLSFPTSYITPKGSPLQVDKRNS